MNRIRLMIVGLLLGAVLVACDNGVQPVAPSGSADDEGGGGGHDPDLTVTCGTTVDGSTSAAGSTDETDEYVEVVNRGACAFDASALELRIDSSLEAEVVTFTPPPGTSVQPQGTLRFVEGMSAAANEVALGVEVSDTLDVGGVALCEGPCAGATIATLIDYAIWDDDPTDATESRELAIASFQPAPLDPTAMTAGQSWHRIAFDGTGGAFLAGDWAIAPATPND